MKTAIAGLLAVAAVLNPLCTPLWAGTYEALERIRRDSNLERRAKKALVHAESCVERVGRAYRESGPEQGEVLLEEIQASVEFAKESLDATGKNPSRKPKHFKRAEIATRGLIGSLNDLETKLGFDERALLQAVRARIAEINGEILMGIMGKKK